MADRRLPPRFFQGFGTAQCAGIGGSLEDGLSRAGGFRGLEETAELPGVVGGFVEPTDEEGADVGGRRGRVVGDEGFEVQPVSPGTFGGEEEKMGMATSSLASSRTDGERAEEHLPGVFGEVLGG